MLQKQQYKEDLLKVLDVLPEQKISQLIEFASFLMFSHPKRHQHKKNISTTIDKQCLLMQQKSLSEIWDNPEEDIYDL